MVFNNIKYRFQEVSERMENYVESTLEYYKLRSFKVLAKVTISLLNFIIYGSLFLFVFLFFSIGAAFWLSTFFESTYVGFLLIGGFYSLILIFMFIFGRKMIQQKILNVFSEIFYDEDDEKYRKPTSEELDELDFFVREEARRSGTSR